MLFSENGFDPRIWGPHLWTVMHILSMNYPLVPTVTQRKAYYNFFKSLCTILPCARCRHEFCLMVNSPGPLQLTPEKFMQMPYEKPGAARVRVVNYIIALHHKVNRRLGKMHHVKKPREYWIRKYASLRAR